MNTTLLNEARKRFKKGDLFITATKNIKVPMVVNTLLMSENYPNQVNNENGGVLVYKDEDTGELVWAEKLEK